MLGSVKSGGRLYDIMVANWRRPETQGCEPQSVCISVHASHNKAVLILQVRLMAVRMGGCEPFWGCAIVNSVRHKLVVLSKEGCVAVRIGDSNHHHDSQKVLRP